MKKIIVIVLVLFIGCYTLVLQGSPLIITNAELTIATCNADNGAVPLTKKNDGSIKVSWTGGSGRCMALLYNDGGLLLQSQSDINDSTWQFSDLSSGSYTIKIQDSLDIIADKTVELMSKYYVLLSAIPYPVNCKGESNGKIRLEVNSTTQYVKFELDEKYVNTTDTNTTFTNLAGGYYNAKVTNSEGCVDSIRRVLIYEPKLLTVTDSVVNINKYNDSTGKIIVVITGGASPYNYSFTINDSLKLDTGLTASRILKDKLKAGIYYFKISDANNCRVSLDNVLVWQPLPLVLKTEVQHVSCYGFNDAAISLSAEGGLGNYLYGIDNGMPDTASTFNNLAARSAPYSVFVKDSVGVIQTQDVIISQPDSLIGNIVNVYPLRCNDDSSGAVKLNIQEGTFPYYISSDTVQWFPGDSIGNLKASNDYKIFFRDINNCLSSLSVNITQPTKLIITLDSVKRPFCPINDGIVYTSVAGGTVSADYNFQWIYLDSSKVISNQDQYMDKLYAGHYVVKVIDDNQCEDTLQVRFSSIDDLHFDSIAVSHLLCFGDNNGKINIYVSGGKADYSYFLNGLLTVKDITGLTAQSYKVKSTDANGCAIQTTVVLRQPDPLSVSGTIIKPVCYNSNDGSVNLSVSGGNGNYHFRWSDGETTSSANQIGKGTYSVSVTDRNNCLASKQYQVQAPDPPSPHWKENQANLCNGNDKTLYGGEYPKYLWKKNEEVIDTVHNSIIINQTGLYVLQLTDDQGCVATDTFKLTVSGQPFHAVLLLPDSACVGKLARTIDVTWPVPDSIKWLYDKPVKIDFTNSWSQKFTSTTAGIINVTLQAYYGGCFSDSSKTIMFYDSSKFVAEKTLEEQPVILDFYSYPNPTNGIFNVKIVLRDNIPVRLSLLTADANLKCDQRQLSGYDVYNVEFNIQSLITGTYVLLLEAGNERKVMKIIKSY